VNVKSIGAIAMAVALCAGAADAATTSRMIGVNVVLKQDVTKAVLTDIARFGKVRDVIYEIDALTLQAREADLAKIRALPYVAAANPDAARNGAPVDTVAATDFMDGLSTWDQDSINVTDSCLFCHPDSDRHTTTHLPSRPPCFPS